MATAYLLQLIIEMTNAKTDQEHLDAIVFDRPRVPDRTAHILDPKKPSPLPLMQKTAQTLEGLGASVLCAPCITSHYFYRQLQESVHVPFLNMVKETARELKENGRRKVGVMATTGTARTGLFQRALQELGLESVFPDEQGQELTMEIIYGEIKAGRPADPEKFEKVSRALFLQGCDSIILGCTELSLIKKTTPLGHGYLDALEVLSKRCVTACEAPLKAEYENLIT